jgi:hypothetical protein
MGRVANINHTTGTVRFDCSIISVYSRDSLLFSLKGSLMQSAYSSLCLSTPNDNVIISVPKKFDKPLLGERLCASGLSSCCVDKLATISATHVE